MRRTRTGVFNILDDKMRVVGGIMLRNRVLEIVEEFGVDYFERALREILERERREILQRIRTEMVPGRYRWRSFKKLLYKDVVGPAFPEAARDHLLHFANEITITPEATLQCDFAGSSSQNYHHLNCYGGQHGFGQCGSLFTFLVHSPLVNTSLHYVLRACESNPRPILTDR
jgi:N-methylhydantoinase B/oxoprolinase/acetone carboxylase alpha subunit